VTATVSQPVRIAAVCGLLAALTIGGGLMMLGRHSGTSAAPAPVVLKHHPFGPGAKKLAQTHKLAASKPVVTHVKLTKPPAVHKVAPRRSQWELAALSAGLPRSLARALGQHSVVVVELYDPQSETDAIAYAEAQAGAQVAHVGFLPLSVLGPDVNKLTQKFGQVLPDPGLLVYTRPATVAARIGGFADKDTVAQAAANAAHGS
jgi:hypothetical protein